MPIDVLPGARQDLKQLRVTDPGAFAAVLAFLEEAGDDSDLYAKLTTAGDVDFETFHVTVRRWVSAQSSGNLLRIRILDTPATSYRVVYGYDWRKRRIGVLAIVHKERFDYELDSTLGRRILSDWHIATDGQPT